MTVALSVTDTPTQIPDLVNGAAYGLQNVSRDAVLHWAGAPTAPPPDGPAHEVPPGEFLRFEADDEPAWLWATGRVPARAILTEGR